MSFIRARFASRLSAVAMALLGASAAAAEPLGEASAIDSALAREGLAELETAQRDEATATVAGVRSFDNPTVEVSRESAGGEGGWRLGVVQTLDLSGRRGALRAAARAEAAAVGGDIERRRQELIGEVRGAYARCAAAGGEAQVRSAFVAQLREAERVVTARARAGDTAVYDMRRVRVAARSAEAELTRTEGEHGAACATLSSLTGIDAARVEMASLTGLASATHQPNRPDLVARERRIEAATQRITAARRARIPAIELSAGIKRVTDENRSAYGPVLSVGVTVPLFYRGGAEIAVAEARERALKAELAITRHRVTADQQAAAVRVRSSRDAAVTAARAREDAARLGRIAETAYQSGEVGVVELLDAYEAARDAELKVIELARAAAEAAIAFDLANGGL